MGDKNARTSAKVYDAAARHISSAPHVDLFRYNGNITGASRGEHLTSRRLRSAELAEREVSYTVRPYLPICVVTLYEIVLQYTSYMYRCDASR